MTILSIRIGYAHKIVEAKLDPSEWNAPKEKIIAIADNGGSPQPIRHFGGVVTYHHRDDGIYATIKVYTD